MRMRMRKVLFVLLFTVGGCSGSPEEGDSRCNASPWPDSTPAAYPINQDRSSRGRNFAIVNARRTHEAIDELHGTSSENSEEENVRTLLSKINTLQDIRYYLSHEVTHECSIETTEETCLKIESDESDIAFFGIYNVSFPYPDDPDRFYIQQLKTEDICIFGTLMVMSSDSAESWHICDLDRMFYLFLGRNTEYRLSFQWNSARTAKHVMFSLPLSASQDIQVTCGKRPYRITTAAPTEPDTVRITDPVSDPTTTLSTTEVVLASKQDRVDEGSGEDKKGFTPELIAAIAIGCSVSIAAVIMTVLIIHAKRMKNPPDSKAAAKAYEAMHSPLVRDNSYQEDPTFQQRNTTGHMINNAAYEQPIQDSNPYAEIPADLNQSDYADLATENSAAVTDSQSHYSTITDTSVSGSTNTDGIPPIDNKDIYVIPTPSQSVTRPQGQRHQPYTAMTPNYIELIGDPEQTAPQNGENKNPHYIDILPHYLELIQDAGENTRTKETPPYIEILGDETDKIKIPNYIEDDEEDKEMPPNSKPIPNYLKLLRDAGEQRKEGNIEVARL